MIIVIDSMRPVIIFDWLSSEGGFTKFDSVPSGGSAVGIRSSMEDGILL